MRYLAAILLFSQIALAQTEWEWLNPTPSPYTIADIAWASVYVVYTAGESGTVMRSSDAGSTWQVFDRIDGVGFPLLAIAAVDEHTVLAAGYGEDPVNRKENFVLRSADSGFTWTRIPLGTHAIVNDIAVTESGDILVAGDIGCLKRSTDAGLTWQDVDPSIGESLTGISLGEGGFGAINAWNTGVYTTTDGGLSWTLHKAQQRFSVIEAVGAATLFAADTISSLWKSTDRGVTWYQLPFVIGAKISALAALSEDLFLASTTSRYVEQRGIHIYRFIDGGMSWTSALYPDSSYLPTLTVRSIEQSPAVRVLAAGTGGALLFTDDGGVTWEFAAEPALHDLKRVNFYDEKHGCAVAAHALYITTDGGDSWTIREVDAEYNDCEQIDRDRIVAVGSDDGDAILDMSTDGGATWVRRTNNEAIGFLSVEYVNDGLIFVGGMDHLFYTSDYGDTWLEDHHMEYVEDIQINSDGVGYALLSYGIFREHYVIVLTFDNGRDWIPHSTRALDGRRAVVFSDSTYWVLYPDGDLSTGTGDKIHLPTRAGVTDFHMFSKERGYLLSRTQGMYSTTDGWQSWTHEAGWAAGLEDIHCIQSGDCWAVGRNGRILAKRNTATGIAGAPQAGEQGFALSASYPSPTTSTASVAMTLPDAGWVSLTLHDLTGRRVKTLEEGYRSAGRHSVRFSTSGLQAGVYIYRLVTGYGTKAAKLVVVK